MKPAAGSQSYQHADEMNKKVRPQSFMSYYGDERPHLKDWARKISWMNENGENNIKVGNKIKKGSLFSVFWTWGFTSGRKKTPKKWCNEGWVRPHTRYEEAVLYLHWDVRYGGGGQVKVLLDQNVEFGGQVPPSTNTVNLAGEQRRNLGHKRGVLRKMTASTRCCSKQCCYVSRLHSASHSHVSWADRTPACPHPVDRCELGPARTAGWPSA